ncbi:MAG: AAA family ATPase [Phycisphaerae bacterium]
MNTGQLFGQTSFIPRDGLRVVVTGQVGIDKQPFLEEVIQLAAQNGIKAKLFNVGEMMYKESPDVAAGRILDLPISRLSAIRRAVFRDILTEAERTDNIIVNTHATFRWRHGLFPAFDHDLILRFAPNMFITLVDNVDSVHLRLIQDHNSDHSLKDLLVWREEEILATEVLATVTRGFGCFYMAARGQTFRNVESFYRLIFAPKFKKVYTSFPMTHLHDHPNLQDEIDRFRRVMSDHFISFDPGDLEEKQLQDYGVKAAEENRRYVNINVLGQDVQFEVAQLLEAAGDINGQIYARDFKFIEQSDMIVSYIPTNDAGKPLISSGVERELQHAHESAKEAYVIWTSKTPPSPFITETATRVFANLDQAMAHFQSKRYIKSYQRQI